jgi:hypothetical protein
MNSRYCCIITTDKNSKCRTDSGRGNDEVDLALELDHDIVTVSGYEWMQLAECARWMEQLYSALKEDGCVRGRLHVYESVYDSPYDSMNNLPKSQVGIQFFMRHL